MLRCFGLVLCQVWVFLACFFLVWFGFSFVFFVGFLVFFFRFMVFGSFPFVTALSQEGVLVWFVVLFFGRVSEEFFSF